MLVLLCATQAPTCVAAVNICSTVLLRYCSLLNFTHLSTLYFIRASSKWDIHVIKYAIFVFIIFFFFLSIQTVRRVNYTLHSIFVQSLLFESETLTSEFPLFISKFDKTDSVNCLYGYLQFCPRIEIIWSSNYSLIATYLWRVGKWCYCSQFPLWAWAAF